MKQQVGRCAERRLRGVQWQGEAYREAGSSGISICLGKILQRAACGAKNEPSYTADRKPRAKSHGLLLCRSATESTALKFDPSKSMPVEKPEAVYSTRDLVARARSRTVQQGTLSLIPQVHSAQSVTVSSRECCRLLKVVPPSVRPCARCACQNMVCSGHVPGFSKQIALRDGLKNA